MRRKSSVIVVACVLALLAGVGLWLLLCGKGGPVARPADTAGAGAAAGAVPDPGAEKEREVAAAGESAQAPAPDEWSFGSPDAPVAIEGTVRDSSGAGVARARVLAVSRATLEETFTKNKKLLDRAPTEAMREFGRVLADLVARAPACRSAADGRYAFRGLAPGDYRIAVTHPEFLPHAEGEWIPVKPGQRARYDVELVAGYSIAGVARDTDGRPVAGARVEATASEKARLRGIGRIVQVFLEQHAGAAFLEADAVTTDSRGAFRTGALAPGAYDLRLVKEGFAWGEARDVAAGTEDVTVILAPALRVMGRIVAPEETPVAAAHVTLREPEADIHGPAGNAAIAYLDVDLFGVKECRGVTGEDGRFALDAYVRGTYDLLVRAGGFPELRRDVMVQGATLELGDVVLAENREIAGTVRSPDGRPLAGADVWVPKRPVRTERRDSRKYSVLEAGPSSSLARTRTDAGGAFVLTGLVDEAFEVAARADGYPGEVLERVAAGSGDVAITLPFGLTVRGRVIDAERGRPLAGARVDSPWVPESERTTDDAGRFEITGIALEEGQTFGAAVVVRAKLEGYREAQETVAFADPRAAPAAETELVLERMDAETLICGIVLDGRGTPCAGARVWTEVPGLPLAFVRALLADQAKEVLSGADGTFALPALRIGSLRFYALASYPGLATARVGPFVREGEGAWPFIEIRLDRGAAVQGRVTSTEGAAIGGARVRLWREDQMPEEATLFNWLLPPAEGEVTYSARDGTFRFRGVTPGVYRVQGSAAGYAAKTVRPLEIDAPAGTGQEGDGAPARVDIVLEAGGTLQGRVVDAAGAPCAGIEVAAFAAAELAGASPDIDDEVIKAGALGTASAVTRADGTYAIVHLAEGEYFVLARARGFEPASIASARPGTALPDLVLEPHARIAGHVRDGASDEALARFDVWVERRNDDGKFRVVHGKVPVPAGAEGRFLYEELRAGEWRVHVRSPGYIAWHATVSLAPGGEAYLEAGLDAGRRIAGVVTLPDGTPLAGIVIDARHERPAREGGRQDLESTRSDARGEFVFAGLEPGSYRVVASHSDYYAEGSEAVANLEVSAGEDGAVRLVLRQAGKLFGRIRGLPVTVPGNDHWVVKCTQIAAESPGRGEAFDIGIEPNGKVRRDSMRPGTYRLAFVHKRTGEDTQGTWVVVPPDNRPLADIEIRVGELTLLDAEAP